MSTQRSSSTRHDGVAHPPDFASRGMLQVGDRQVHLIGTDIETPGIENHIALRVDDSMRALQSLPRTA